MKFFKRRRKKSNTSLLSKKEIELLNEHIREQKLIRKVPEGYRGNQDFLQHIIDDIYHHNMDFIYENKFHEDKPKLVQVWEYLKERL